MNKGIGFVESAKPSDLTPGSYVVIAGVGMMQVGRPVEFQGKPGIKFSNMRSGMAYTTDLFGAKDPTLVRALISKSEAERRLAVLSDPTPVTDLRSEKERHVELTRTIARGTDIQKITLLRAMYASTFAPQPAVIYYLEEEVLAELAQVIGTDQGKLSEKLHAIHGERGTFSKAAKLRLQEPDPVPPQDPWSIAGHSYVGRFTLEGESLVAGDPVYLTSKHEEPPQEVTKNVHIASTAGAWFCYLELDPTDGPVSFIAINETAKNQFNDARHKATSVAKLWVDSGEIALVDSAIRDNPAYDDARLFGADNAGIIGNRGCKVVTGGDGTFPTRIIERDGKAIYVRIEFTGD